MIAVSCGLFLVGGILLGFVGGVVFVLGVRVAAKRKRDRLAAAGIKENADG